MIFPWQRDQWQLLSRAYRENRLSHALLFVGASGIGKKQFANYFAETILCRQPTKDNLSCGDCKSCQLIRAKTHPDLILIAPDENGQLIKIDQIREITDFVNGTAAQNGFKIVIIDSASKMNVNSANALLKTLEEPPSNTIVILIDDASLRLPATILSRCHKLLFQKPRKEIALAWLQKEVSSSEESLELILNLVEGAPLKAKELIESGGLTVRRDFYEGLSTLSQNKIDPLQLAAQFQEHDMKIILNLLLSGLRDLLRLKLSNGNTDIVNQDYRVIFDNIVKKIPQDSLVGYLDLLQQTYARLLKSFNLNRQLVLEEILIKWARLCF